ncbi:protein DBF4 homolog B-like [Hyalella azteca]|uniref:Protein DBF4 homolog B-like n=1 Tax=Hyalella azteca TaxID=294128 RepID=A0A8B7N535_HYAAZ|nr:protein DBF4 homolog B-like [Hyalella azteca]
MVSPSKKKSVRTKATSRSKRSFHCNNHQFPAYQPLASLKFYLHLTGYKNLADITADIKHLGGEVEEFLSKEVQYMIVPTKSVTSSGPSVSPSTGDTLSPSTLPAVFVPSPSSLSPYQGGSPDSSAPIISPLPPTPTSTSHSPHHPPTPSDQTRRVTSRAAALLVRARFRKPGPSDVISNAKRWGVQVWTLAKLQSYISELASDPRYKPRTSPQTQKHSSTAAVLHPSPSSVIKERTILSRPAERNTPRSIKSSASRGQHSGEANNKKPFIKLEDFAKKYRPLFKEISNWPALTIDSSRSTCPFAEGLPPLFPVSGKNKTPQAKGNNCVYSVNSRPLKSPAGLRQEEDNGESFATPNRVFNRAEHCSTPQAVRGGVSRTRRNSGGYCELCRLHYTSLRTHLLSNSHQSFVTDASNYGELDQLISQVSELQSGLQQSVNIVKTKSL